MLKCLKCRCKFEVEEDDDGYPVSTKLCYNCFEEGVEDFEEKRRERIALANEY